MKTPREVLLGKHEGVQPKLDARRHRFTAMLASLRAETLGVSPTARTQAIRPGWRELLRALRWHLAGLTATWLLVALFQVVDGLPEAPPAAQAEAASPRAVILALKANRRQVFEFGQATFPSEPDVLPARLPMRRGALQTNWAYS